MEELRTGKSYVIFSDSVGCPGEVLTSDIVIETNIDIQKESEAKNINDYRYMHYYEEMETELGFHYRHTHTCNA
ncbi:hypothetical protein [Shouchella clausii]|uniref:hypothetical protein n=1 Tax=Shouchella clausii TaxID=79880 RepID=UPI001C7333CF|nr:hypothetical protein [Shouchella clausii]MBX0320157.1 hypothetical protein [Shouchella clausii]MEB5480829.1 hypothetical protein [Shouchella clausii]